MLENYKNKLDTIKKRCNIIYTDLTFTSVGDVLEGVIDLNSVDDEVYQLSTTCYDYYKNIINKLESLSLSDEEFDRLDSLTYDLYKEVDNKLDSLDDLIGKLKNIVELNEDVEITKKFTDIKNLDI
jgi:hypothetical protein